MKRYLLMMVLIAPRIVFAQSDASNATGAVPQVNIPFEFTSEEDNKLIKEDDSLKYYVANGDGTNTVSISEELFYYKLMNKEHKVIAEGPFIVEGEKYLQDGKWIERFDNGKLKITGYYQRDKPMGTWHEYHANGKLKTVYNFALITDNAGTFSCLSGSYDEYYQNGKLKVRGFYMASGARVKDTMYVDDPVTHITVAKILTHDIYTPEKTGHWEYFTESGEPEKKDEN